MEELESHKNKGRQEYEHRTDGKNSRPDITEYFSLKRSTVKLSHKTLMQGAEDDIKKNGPEQYGKKRGEETAYQNKEDNQYGHKNYGLDRPGIIFAGLIAGPGIFGTLAHRLIRILSASALPE
jgi:hypothetical protein